jgi:hypothetical protein
MWKIRMSENEQQTTDENPKLFASFILEEAENNITYREDYKTSRELFEKLRKRSCISLLIKELLVDLLLKVVGKD